jgi:acetoin utilization deacetylase AcuC-like enzyme
MRKVAYLHSPRLLELCDRLPSNLHRATLVHSLIVAYGLIPSMFLALPKGASIDELKEFHDEDYLEFLSTVEGEAEISRHDDDDDDGDGDGDGDGQLQISGQNLDLLDKCKEFGYLSIPSDCRPPPFE